MREARPSLTSVGLAQAAAWPQASVSSEPPDVIKGLPQPSPPGLSCALQSRSFRSQAAARLAKEAADRAEEQKRQDHWSMVGGGEEGGGGSASLVPFGALYVHRGRGRGRERLCTWVVALHMLLFIAQLALHPFLLLPMCLPCHQGSPAAHQGCPLGACLRTSPLELPRCGNVRRKMRQGGRSASRKRTACTKRWVARRSCASFT